MENSPSPYAKGPGDVVINGGSNCCSFQDVSLCDSQAQEDKEG